MSNKKVVVGDFFCPTCGDIEAVVQDLDYESCYECPICDSDCFKKFYLTENRTQRGFQKFVFKDRNGFDCSIQESSIATERCIWLGTHIELEDIQVHAVGTGVDFGTDYWQPLTNFIEREIDSSAIHSRMHISRGMAKALIEKLQEFVDSGGLD